MFGIMKKSCGDSCGIDTDHYRLHYCGTCKSIGNIYDQRSRLLLNFDAVFLAELLSALSNEATSNWQNGYQSKNCFSKIDSQNIPIPLQYAAAVNVFLSELKTLDHIHDEGNFLWKGFQFTFNSSFRKANHNLAEFGLNTDKIQRIFQQQFALEKEQHSLEKYAQPTAEITALIFEKGAQLVQQNVDVVKKIGFEFGKLAYILDALEDYEKDIASNSFNGIQKAFSLKTVSLCKTIRVLIEEKVYHIQNQIIEHLKMLPLGQHIEEAFVGRLMINISKLLHQTITESPEESITEELSFSWKKSKEQANAIVREIKQPIQQKIKYAALSIAIFVRPEAIDSFRSMNIHQIGISATLVTLLSAFACFAGKKQRKIRRRLKWFQKGCFDCNICSLCDCCDCFSGCFKDTFCGNCCDGCQKDCNRECNKLLKAILWTLFGLLILGIIILIIVLIAQ